MNNYTSSLRPPWYSYRTSMETIVLEEGVTSIGNYAFYACYYTLGSIVIPNSVTTIGDRAFYNLTRLDGTLTIGSSVTSIGDYAFAYSYKIIGVLNIGSSVETIGERAFLECYSFTGLTIPNSVTSIGDAAFTGCSALAFIDVDENNTAYCSESDILFNKEKTILIQCATGKTGDYTVSGLVTEIKTLALAGCLLTSINVEESNTVYSSIDGVLFNKEKDLLIQCPAGRTGHYTVPAATTEIGYHAFYFCRGLTSVTIGNLVETIGACAFYQCTNLTGALIIPNSVKIIGAEAFYECQHLTSATIGNSVTSIGQTAFYRCFDLTYLIIGSSVETLASYAFEYCTGLVSVYNLRETPQTLTGSGPFYNTPTGNIDLYVPEASIAAYQGANTWKSFKQILAVTYCTVTFDPNNGEDVINGSVVYNTLTTPPEAINPGYTLTGWYNDGELWDFNTPVTENITLTAQWTVVSIETIRQPQTLTAWTQDGMLYVSGLAAGEKVSVYTLAGSLIAEGTQAKGIKLPSKGIYIVKQGKRAVKVKN
ncbi:MAG: leucine-rich repeat protein [Treponema sp.]|nr:leucine-rich repeat protein [Treponema sp.]